MHHIFVMVRSWELPKVKQYLDKAKLPYMEERGAFPGTSTLQVECSEVGTLERALFAAFRECSN